MNIYIGNLSLEVTANDLLEEFTRYGEVESVTIMDDKYIGSGQKNGYGYVQMICKEEAENAIANLEGKTLKNRVIKVVAALPLTKNENRSHRKAGKPRPNKNRERNYPFRLPEPSN